MSDNVTHITKSNAEYSKDFKKGDLALPPARKLTIVTCMDARIDPAASLGISEGDAHIIRNAGGSAKEALRSIIISQRLLGTREVAVFHHTDCGMLTFDNDHIRGLIKKADPSPEVAKEVDSIDFLTFPELESSVKDDVKFLNDNKLVLNEAKVSGWVYDVHSGKIKQVA